MKKSKTVLFLLFFILSFISSFAQSNEGLLESVPTSREEFTLSEKKVISTVNWLENTPLDQQTEKRKEQYGLLLGWITKAPNVTIELHADIISFSKKNDELLMLFMGGWTKYCLENNYSTDVVKGNVAGLKSAIKVYKKGVGVKKDKSMEKLADADEKGDLEKWVKEQLAKK